MAKTALLDFLMEEKEADAGTNKWGVTTTQSYFEMIMINTFKAAKNH